MIDVLMLCREALQAKKQEAAEVGAAMKKLQEQESKAQQAVDGLQQKFDDLNAEAERLRELQKSGSADVSASNPDANPHHICRQPISVMG